MAIVPGVPGFQIRIMVNGRPLNEFDDTDAIPRRKSTTKYVEAPEGGTFQIQYSFKKSPRLSIFPKVYIDGKEFLDINYDYEGKLCRETGERVSSIMGTFFDRRGKSFAQKFAFSKLNIVEADQPVTREIRKGLNSLGQIMIKLYYGEEKTPTRGSAQRSRQKRITSTQIDTIPEKALKGRAISQQAILLAPEHIPTREATCAMKFRDGPFATATFKYRSTADLKALGIIPRTPSPPAEQEPEVQLPDQDMTDEQVRLAFRKMMQEQGTKRKRDIKQESTNIKQETSYIKKERGLAVQSVDSDDEVTILSARAKRRRQPCEDDEVIALDD